MSAVFPSWYASTLCWSEIRAKRYAALLEPKAGSPLEVLLGASLLIGAYETGFPLSLDEDRDGVFVLRQQSHIGSFRVDFLIEGRGKKLVIECDGRDFHHSTREQIERDRKRDADLSAMGYTVFRYPGTQLHSDIWGVVAQIYSWLDAEEAVRFYRENADFL